MHTAWGNWEKNTGTFGLPLQMFHMLGSAPKNKVSIRKRRIIGLYNLKFKPIQFKNLVSFCCCFALCFFFQDRIFLCSYDFPETYNVDKTGIGLPEIHCLSLPRAGSKGVRHRALLCSFYDIVKLALSLILCTLVCMCACSFTYR